MSASGKDWDVVLGRITRARIKALLGVEALQRAESQLVEGDDDAALYATCKAAAHHLDMAVALLRELTRAQVAR